MSSRRSSRFGSRLGSSRFGSSNFGSSRSFREALSQRSSSMRESVSQRSSNMRESIVRVAGQLNEYVSSLKRSKPKKKDADHSIKAGLKKRQCVENAFDKVNLAGSITSKRSAGGAFPPNITDSCLKSPEIHVDVRLERMKDRGRLSQLRMANTASLILDQSLSEYFHVERGDSPTPTPTPTPVEKAPTPDAEVCLEVRVVVATEGSPLRRLLFGRTACASLAVTWCLYTRTGKVLKAGRCALGSKDLKNDDVLRKHLKSIDNKEAKRRRLLQYMSNMMTKSITSQILGRSHPSYSVDGTGATATEIQTDSDRQLNFNHKNELQTSSTFWERQ